EVGHSVFVAELGARRAVVVGKCGDGMEQHQQHCSSPEQAHFGTQFSHRAHMNVKRVRRRKLDGRDQQRFKPRSRSREIALRAQEPGADAWQTPRFSSTTGVSGMDRGPRADLLFKSAREEVDGRMASGRILRISEGWLVLANPKSGGPNFAINP